MEVLWKLIKMNELKKEIINNYDSKEKNHIFSIILRAWHETKKMDSIKKNLNFKLAQMEDFIINYDNGKFEFSFNNKKIEITIDEINELVEDIYVYFNEKYPTDYDYKLIDPVYFSLFFYDVLDKIINIKYDVINISDIRLLRYNSNPVKMEESERYKALVDKNHKMYSPFKSNLIIETPEKRLENALMSIKKNGYGYNGKYEIFYNDEPYIRDGQHRVSAIKYLYGDIDLKILRIYLKDNYFYK